MPRRIICVLLAGLLFLSACASRSIPEADPAPEPSAAAENTPAPWIFDSSALRPAAYELRQTQGVTARLRTQEEPPCETDARDISLLSPITVRAADASANGLGTVVALEGNMENTVGVQYLALCQGLTLAGEQWPALTVDATYGRELTVAGGELGDLVLDSGEITVRRARLIGAVSVRGAARLTLEDCLFAPGAVIATAGTPDIVWQGTRLSPGEALPPELSEVEIAWDSLEQPAVPRSLPTANVTPDALVGILPPAPPEETPEPEPTPEPTEEPVPESGEIPADSGGQAVAADPAQRQGSYYIKVNVGANTVTVYSRDAAGNFTQPFMAMVCSTGWDTPATGVYTPGVRHRWHALFGGVYGQYTTQITGNILFHSVPYLTYNDPGSLEYWEFDKLGTTCSMGCVRLQVRDAQWIYDNAWQVAGIEFYSNADPGPLGMPGSPHIGENEYARGWDPTDSDSRNPWLNPTPEPVVTPAPTMEPTPEPTPEITPAPTQEPTPAPTQEPTPAPTEEPTDEPTVEPTADNTGSPDLSEPVTELDNG